MSARPMLRRPAWSYWLAQIRFHIAANAELRRLARAIDSLPAEPFEVFRLSRFHGMDNEQIAEVLDIDVAQVEARLAEAMLAIGRSLEAQKRAAAQRRCFWHRPFRQDH